MRSYLESVVQIYHLEHRTVSLMEQQYAFSDFQVLQNLDSTHGGMTKLYVVKNQGRIQVCKSMKKESFKDAKSIEHVKNEKQALIEMKAQKVQGVNQIIDTFQDSENIYMLLEMVQGLPLHKLLKMVGKLNPEFTRLIVTQVGLILHDFHNQGFVYRDIKASNFMINRKGQVTMIDLGKAKKISRQRAFTICGTTHSMPPEIYQGKGYSYEFDYYGFGVLLYELLTGSPPFGYEDFTEEYLQKLKQGLQEEHLYVIECPLTRDLISQLMAQKEHRLGSQRGFEQILEHEYFNFPEFLDYKDILEGEEEVDPSDERFQFYISEIEDFGLDPVKFEEIGPEDPFYKFYS